MLFIMLIVYQQPTSLPTNLLGGQPLFAFLKDQYCSAG